MILNTINTILKKDFFQKRVVEQRQRIKSESVKKLCQFFYLYSKQSSQVSDNNLDQNIDTQPADFNKHTESRRHLRTFIPKIIATFSGSRAVPPPPSQAIFRRRPLSVPHSPTRRSRKYSEQPVDRRVPLAGRAVSFTEINNEM